MALVLLFIRNSRNVSTPPLSFNLRSSRKVTDRFLVFRLVSLLKKLLKLSKLFAAVALLSFRSRSLE